MCVVLVGVGEGRGWERSGQDEVTWVLGQHWLRWLPCHFRSREKRDSS